MTWTEEERALIADWSEEEQELAALVKQGEAVVLSERKRGPHQHILAWSKARGSHTYIGRRNHYTQHVQSPFANPYSAKKYGRNECIEMYREHLMNHPDLFAQAQELHGQTLGCWCSPEACHGDVLADIANESNLK